MNESIIVGLVVGSGVAVIGAYIGYLFRLREMKALWAEEEQRRQSDRRREARERDLRKVRDSVDGVLEAVMGGWQEQTLELRVGLVNQGYATAMKALVAARSLDDGELTVAVKQLMKDFGDFDRFLDLEVGETKEGKEGEFSEWVAQIGRAGSEVLHRIREMEED